MLADVVIDWTIVLVALITAVPATIGAYASVLNSRRLKTSNGHKIGELVELTHKNVENVQVETAAVKADTAATKADVAATKAAAEGGA